MKSSKILLRVVFASLLLAMCAVAAHADSIADPTIVIRDPSCPTGCMSVGTNFTFGTPSTGTGVLFFTNASGVDWFNLKLVEAGVPANLITCVTDVFSSCTATTVNGITTILLSGVGGNFSGLLAGSNFSIVFGCATGTCDPWPGNLDFTATANVPEPGTVALLMTGVGALFTKRKQWLRSRS